MMTNSLMFFMKTMTKREVFQKTNQIIIHVNRSYDVLMSASFFRFEGKNLLLLIKLSLLTRKNSYW